MQAGVQKHPGGENLGRHLSRGSQTCATPFRRPSPMKRSEQKAPTPAGVSLAVSVCVCVAPPAASTAAFLAEGEVGQPSPPGRTAGGRRPAPPRLQGAKAEGVTAAPPPPPLSPRPRCGRLPPSPPGPPGRGGADSSPVSLSLPLSLSLSPLLSAVSRGSPQPGRAADRYRSGYKLPLP